MALRIALLFQFIHLIEIISQVSLNAFQFVISRKTKRFMCDIVNCWAFPPVFQLTFISQHTHSVNERFPFPPVWGKLACPVYYPSDKFNIAKDIYQQIIFYNYYIVTPTPSPSQLRNILSVILIANRLLWFFKTHFQTVYFCCFFSPF